MTGYIFLGTLAAFGLMVVIWCLFGWLLPHGAAVIVCPEGADPHTTARRYLWLRGLGLVRCPLIVADDGLAKPERVWMEDHGIIVCPPEEILRWLRTGEKDSGRTGNGDPPGRGQCRGISEL